MKIMPIMNGTNFGRKITKHEANGYIQGNCDCKPKNYEVGKFAGIGTQTLEVIDVNNAIVDMRLEDHEKEKKTNTNPYYRNYTKGLPDRFERFRIK